MADPQSPVRTASSEDATEADLLAERARLEAKLRQVEQLGTRTAGRPDPNVQQRTYEALVRNEVMLEMAAEAIRAHTDQLVIANKIAVGELRLQRERYKRGARTMDELLRAGSRLAARAVTDRALWAAVGGAVVSAAAAWSQTGLPGCH